MRLTILAGLLALLPNPTTFGRADEAAFRLTLRTRVEKAGGYAVATRAEAWPAGKTAVIVCDMWDAHHCLNAVRRENEMVPRTEAFLTAARAKGALIIHAPSGCMAAYQDHPARERARAAPTAKTLPKGIDQWCSKIPAEDNGKYPIDQSDGGEDDDPAEHAEWHAKLAAMGRNPKAPWQRQHAGLTIRPGDAVSESGVEVWNLLEARGIDRVMLVGVHTNMCVLGRPFGLRQLAKNGKTVVLVRDLTDAMYNPRMPPMVSHFEGTRLVVAHIEKFVCPTVTSDQLLGGREFRFAGDE